MAAESRWAAGIEYDGSECAGWQRQAHAPSVQAHVERVLSAVADQPVSVVAAGRTDAGVHALAQVIHFETTAVRKAHGWLLGANTQLPMSISLRWVQPVAGDFDARRTAISRRYRYVIHNSRARSALWARRAAWIVPPLDATAMHRAAQALLGEHDFSAFRSAECQSRTPMRCVQRIEVSRSDDFVAVDVSANAFLHHMVRNIAGVLLAVGAGDQPETWPATVLASRQRTAGGVTAPACGLYFVGPTYPAALGIPPPPEPWLP